MKATTLAFAMGCACFAWLTASEALAQSAFGAFGGTSMNTASSNFDQLEGVVNCNSWFTEGKGVGGTAGLFYERAIIGKAAMVLRGVYRQADNTLVSDELTAIGVDGLPTSARIEHVIDATIGIIGIQPMVKVGLFSGLSLSAGFEVGYVLQGTFNQRETLVEPTDVGAFTSGSRTRNEQSGQIPNANIFTMSFVTALHYAFPLNPENTIQLVPEVSYQHALTPIAKNLSWFITSLHGSIGVRVVIPERPVISTPQTPDPQPPSSIPSTIADASPLNEEPVIVETAPVVHPPAIVETTPFIEKPVVKEHALHASIGATGVDQNGNEHDVARLRIEEVASTRVIPILPYIFFEPNATTLSSKYRHVAEQESALAIHAGMLHELATRMRANPDATLYIRGMTVSNKHVNIERATATARAEAVAAYMHETLGITRARLHVASSPLLHANTPSLHDNDGMEEVNRVDLMSSDPDILAPVRLHDTSRVSTPPTLRFRPSVESTNPLLRWQLTTSQNGKGIKVFKGLGTPPEYIDWNLATEEEAQIPSVPGVVEVTFDAVTDKDSARAVNAVSVEQITMTRKKADFVADKEVEQFSIVLFDIGSSALTEAQLAILRTEIKPRIRKNSVVMVTGYSDRLGDAGANAALSLQRAVNTARHLGVPHAVVRGVGESTLLYDNSTPEARCLSRTVTVRIESPAGSP